MAYKYIGELQRARSDSSRAAWERRWERDFAEGKPLGEKGQEYIDKTYGPEVGGSDWELEDDWPDVWDWRDDDTGDCG